MSLTISRPLPSREKRAQKKAIESSSSRNGPAPKVYQKIVSWWLWAWNVDSDTSPTLL